MNFTEEPALMIMLIVILFVGVIFLTRAIFSIPAILRELKMQNTMLFLIAKSTVDKETLDNVVASYEAKEDVADSKILNRPIKSFGTDI